MQKISTSTNSMSKKRSWEHEANLKVPVYTYLASSFLGLTALLFVVVGFFAISRGRVFVTLKTETVPVDMPVEVFGFVREVNIEGQETAAVPQGTTTVGKARGTVTLINTSGAPQPLVATTRLLTPDNVLFRITKSVTIPAKGQINVEAAADEAGKRGEIGPTTFTIPGLKPARQKEVFAKNTVAFVAPSETTSAVTQELIDQTTSTLREKLLAQAWDKVQALPLSGSTAETPPAWQKDSLEATITSKKVSAQAGARVAQVTVTLNLKVRAVAVHLDQLQTLALKKIQETVSQTKAVALEPDSLTLSVQNTSLDPERAVLRLRAKAKTQMKTNDPLFAKKYFLGFSRDAVQKYFQEIPGVEKVDVKISPFWVKTMPASERRLKVFFLNSL